MKEEELYDGARDSYDERNYSYSELVGDNDEEIPDYVLLDNGVIQDQYKAGYPYGCVYFASSMNDNYCNGRDGIKTRTHGGELCEASDTRDPKAGDYIINGPKLLKKLEHIDGYFQVENSVEEMKKVLAGHNPIHVGSNNINWTKTRENDGLVVKGNGGGHCFHIIGYNCTGKIKYDTPYKVPNNVFICKDSSTGFDNGFFYISFDDIDLLFDTKLVFINNPMDILTYKENIMKNINLESARLAMDLALWNGERPTDTVTREECAAMIYRLYEKMSK